MGSSNAKTSIADEIYLKLKAQIVELQIEPSLPLTEKKLTTMLEASRTPIREALRMLEQDQLVERNHNKGFTVRGISEQDMREVFELRAMLESWAAGKAASIISKENLAVIKGYLDEAEMLYEKGEVALSDECSNQIHDVIAFVVNNRWFSKTAKDLALFTTSYKLLASRHAGQIEQAHQEHKLIYAALQAHKAERAAQLMVEHITHSQEVISEALKSRTYSNQK